MAVKEETRGKQPRKKKSKISKRLRQEEEADRKEEELTALIFGGTTEKPTRLIDTAHESKKDRDDGKHMISMRTGKRSLATNDSEEEDDDDSASDEESDVKNVVDASPWHDPDDSQIVVNAESGNRLKKLRDSREETKWDANELEQRLRQRYEKTAGRTSRANWAKVEKKAIRKGADADDDDDDDDNGVDTIQAESGRMFSTKGNQLPRNVIEILRLKDANVADPCGTVLRTVSFHPASDPESPLLMTAGLDKSIRFYSIGKDDESRKVHGIHFPKLPIYKASFLPNSNSVIATGRRSFFYMYDMVAGKVDFVPGVLGREEKSWESHVASKNGDYIAFLGNDGYIVLIDPRSKQSAGTMKLNGSVRSVTFTPDGNYVLASGSDSDITRWDLRTRKCVEKFSNYDGTVTSALDSTDGYFASGAESGVVNLYSASSNTFGKKPIRSIMNVSTPVDNVKFNHDGQILAMTSRFSSDCFKLLHVPSRTVFANWPTSKTPLNYVFSMDFSPKSRFLSVGNDKGKCLLYKIKHYYDK